jgi:hypothetical protein
VRKIFYLFFLNIVFAAQVAQASHVDNNVMKPKLAILRSASASALQGEGLQLDLAHSDLDSPVGVEQLESPKTLFKKGNSSLAERQLTFYSDEDSCTFVSDVINDENAAHYERSLFALLNAGQLTFDRANKINKAIKNKAPYSLKIQKYCFYIDQINKEKGSTLPIVSLAKVKKEKFKAEELQRIEQVKAERERFENLTEKQLHAKYFRLLHKNGRLLELAEINKRIAILQNSKK